MKKPWLRVAIPLLAVLIVAAALEYWLGGWKAVKKEFSRSKVAGACGLTDMGGAMFDFPEDTGPEDAKVKIVAYVHKNNHCHYDGCQALHDLALKYPDTVRLEIRDAESEEAQKIAEERKIDTLMWLLINDMDKIKLPDRDQPIAFRGPPGAISYDLRDIEAIINYALTEKGAKDLAKQRERVLASLKAMKSADKAATKGTQGEQKQRSDTESN